VEEAVILIEVYAVEGHLGAVIQSGPAGAAGHVAPYISCTLYGWTVHEAALDFKP
jgi:hypothetical protein